MWNLEITNFWTFYETVNIVIWDLLWSFKYPIRSRWGKHEEEGFGGKLHVPPKYKTDSNLLWYSVRLRRGASFVCYLELGIWDFKDAPKPPPVANQSHVLREWILCFERHRARLPFRHCVLPFFVVRSMLKRLQRIMKMAFSRFQFLSKIRWKVHTKSA